METKDYFWGPLCSFPEHLEQEGALREQWLCHCSLMPDLGSQSPRMGTVSLGVGPSKPCTVEGLPPTRPKETLLGPVMVPKATASMLMQTHPSPSP